MAQTTEADATSDPAVEPDPQDTPQPGQQPPAARRSIALPLVLGGVVAAGLGAAAAYYAGQFYPALVTGSDSGAMTARIEAQAAEIAALNERLANLPATVAPDTTSQEALAATQVLTKGQQALKDSLASLSERVARLENAPVSSSGATALDVAAATEAATQAAKAAEEEAARLKAEAEAATRRASLVAASGELSAALESGAALKPGLDLAQSAGVAIPPALADVAQGAPTLRALREAFPPAARDALALSLRATADGTLWSRFTAFLRSQTGARSLAPIAGDDPDAILSRAEAAVVAGDLQAALDELAALPAEGQERMAEWAGLASRRLAAEQALAALQAEIGQ